MNTLPTITIEKINAPGHWTHGLHRVWKFRDGVGEWRYFDTATEAEAYKQTICPHILTAPVAGKCPTCDSPQPHLHPAMQFEGEVQMCRDAWHKTPTNRTPVHQHYFVNRVCFCGATFADAVKATAESLAA